LPFQSPTKFTKSGIFWFENKPSGNPDYGRSFVLEHVKKERKKRKKKGERLQQVLDVKKTFIQFLKFLLILKSS
jgi:hypothetical protein